MYLKFWLMENFEDEDQSEWEEDESDLDLRSRGV